MHSAFLCLTIARIFLLLFFVHFVHKHHVKEPLGGCLDHFKKGLFIFYTITILNDFHFLSIAMYLYTVYNKS